LKKFLLLLSFIAVVTVGFSQGSPGNPGPGNWIILTSQAEVDSFPINFPISGTLDSNLAIAGDDISNLDSLASIHIINGNFSIGGVPSFLPPMPGTMSIGNLILSDISGLSNIDSIYGDLEIKKNPLLNSLSDLLNLNDITGSLIIEDNDGLTSLHGLEGITRVGHWFSIDNNDVLTDLSALQNIIEIDHFLFITNNTVLTDITGLLNIGTDYHDLIITGNPLLSMCSIESVCNFLELDSVLVLIENNATGCNSIQQIEDACNGICSSGDITFTSQQEVDDFPSLHPDCTEIDGALIVQGADITNLDSLAQITSCESLILGESAAGNPLLSNIDGLSNITNISVELRLMGNDALSSIAALSFENTFIDGVYIIDNDALLSLEGLENLDTLNILSIKENDALIDLNGLNNLSLIYLYIIIENNDALLNLSGLDSLTTISDHLYIVGNEVLSNIDALSNVTTLYAILKINDNAQLSDLNGLDNVDANTPVSVEVLNNPILSTCNNSFICAFLSDELNSSYIDSNAPGCNSVDDVLNACVNSIEEAAATQINIYPNPAHDYLMIDADDLQLSAIYIYNQLGQAMPLNGTRIIDVSAFPKGMYVVEVESENGIYRERIVVE
jgi:hypothetical protein